MSSIDNNSLKLRDPDEIIEEVIGDEFDDLGENEQLVLICSTWDKSKKDGTRDMMCSSFVLNESDLDVDIIMASQLIAQIIFDAKANKDEIIEEIKNRTEIILEEFADEDIQ